MFCPNCRSELKPGCRTCPFCDSVIGPAAPDLPESERTKLVLLVLWFFLGAFGAHRFYLGHTKLGVAQLLVTWLTCGIGWIRPFIDRILLLVTDPIDADGRVVRRWH